MRDGMGVGIREMIERLEIIRYEITNYRKSQ